MWIVYELLLLIGLLLYLPSAVWRRRLPHRGWTMRLGSYPASVKERLKSRQTIWIHAVSVGEVLAIRPLLKALGQAYPQHPIIISTITPTGFAVASAQMQEPGAVIYFPLDLRWCVRRAFATIQPRILLLVESELWPVTMAMTKARRVPIAVVNGRISARTFSRYQWVKPLLATTLHGVDEWLMQSQVDADRVLQLGVNSSNVHVVGSLKWDASIGARPTPQAVQELAGRLGISDKKLVIIAGSTHRGEERAVLHAFQTLRSSHPMTRLLIAPRHIERLAEVEGVVRHAGLTLMRTSQADTSTPWEVGLIDTMGQLPSYYGLAHVVFVGGSLIPHGGQNPLEATSLGKPVVFGPSMHNFEAITHQLLAHHAARQVASEQELAQVFQELLANPTEARAMGQRAQELTERFQGATQRTLDALAPLLR